MNTLNPWVGWFWLPAALLCHPNLLAAQTSVASPDAARVIRTLKARPEIQRALVFLKKDEANTLSEQRQICEIPAPPFQEGKRAEDYQKRLLALGLANVHIDKEGNVYGVWRGKSKGPTLVVAAHLDTVFPAEIPVKVVEKGGKLYAPGISDNARGLAAVLSLIRGLKTSGVQTCGDILFCGTVGEEGLGDLRGVRALFREHKEIDAFLSIDSADPLRIVYLAAGSRRYEATFKGPGGHSYEAFGQPSANHALGRAVARIADLATPKEPKTTFTVGVIKGGMGVNTIAAEASLLMEIRSTNERELDLLDAEFFAIVKQAAFDENRRWASDKLTVNVTLVGKRPGGSQAKDASIVNCAWEAATVLGLKPCLAGPTSTDANLAISLGIPALTLGGGGKEFNGHSLKEAYDPSDAHVGVQRAFLTMLAIVGVEGVTDPIISRRK